MLVWFFLIGFGLSCSMAALAEKDSMGDPVGILGALSFALGGLMTVLLLGLLLLCGVWFFGGILDAIG